MTLPIARDNPDPAWGHFYLYIIHKLIDIFLAFPKFEKSCARDAWSARPAPQSGPRDCPNGESMQNHEGSGLLLYVCAPRNSCIIRCLITVATATACRRWI